MIFLALSSGQAIWVVVFGLEPLSLLIDFVVPAAGVGIIVRLLLAVRVAFAFAVTSVTLRPSAADGSWSLLVCSFALALVIPSLLGAFIHSGALRCYFAFTF